MESCGSEPFESAFFLVCPVFEVLCVVARTSYLFIFVAGSYFVVCLLVHSPVEGRSNHFQVWNLWYSFYKSAVGTPWANTWCDAAGLMDRVCLTSQGTSRPSSRMAALFCPQQPTGTQCLLFHVLVSTWGSWSLSCCLFFKPF